MAKALQEREDPIPSFRTFGGEQIAILVRRSEEAQDACVIPTSLSVYTVR